MLVEPTGKVQTELDEKEGIAFGEIGTLISLETVPPRYQSQAKELTTREYLDVDLINKTRSGIPITVQRRFDCYTSVSKV